MRRADQLATAIDAGRRGAIKDIKTGEDTRYYPVIVTYEPLPSHPLALRLYEEIVHRGGRLRGTMVKPVTFLFIVPSAPTRIHGVGEAIQSTPSGDYCSQS